MTVVNDIAPTHQIHTNSNNTYSKNSQQTDSLKQNSKAVEDVRDDVEDTSLCSVHTEYLLEDARQSCDENHTLPLFIDKPIGGGTSEMQTSDSATFAPNDEKSQQSCFNWKGRIVALILPSDIDPAFHDTAKPTPPRRVMPSSVILTRTAITENTSTDSGENNKEYSWSDNETSERQECCRKYHGNSWNPWDETNQAVKSNASFLQHQQQQHEDNASLRDSARDYSYLSGKNSNGSYPMGNKRNELNGVVVLDIYLFHSDDDTPSATTTNNQIVNQKDVIHIHMVRDPNEDISQTCNRIKISIEKKLASSGLLLGKKKKQKKQQQTQKLKRINRLPILLQKQQQNVVKRRNEVVNGKSGIDEIDEERNGENSSLMDEWSEAWSLKLCNLWNPLVNSMDHKSDETNACSSILCNVSEEYIKGYTSIQYSNGMTISDAIQDAAKYSCGQHALSIPIEISESKILWIPLMLDSCPPQLLSVSTFGSFEHTHIFERTPIVVECTYIFATRVQISWYADGVEVCHDSHWYSPSSMDVGKRLSIVVIPLHPGHDGTGCEEAYEFQRLVEQLPDMPLLRPLREKWSSFPRQGMEAPCSSPQLRVVTYNILADQNASRDVEKGDGADRMYSHCKLEHIVKWRRHPLIVHEILEYKPDILCLQEVDTDVFEDLLRPVMDAMGYQGFYSQKGVGVASSVREGCATFWSLEKFERVRIPDMQTHTFRGMIERFSCDERMDKSQWKSLSDMTTLLEKHEHLKHVLFHKLGHVLQTVVLTNRSNCEKVVVGNTHLFYHPLASHVRCLKILLACRQLEIEHVENEMCPIIFCGDFNSHPSSGVLKLLLNRHLDSNNGKTWKHLCTYEWDEGANAGTSLQHHGVEGIDLEFPASFPKLVSAYSAKECPEFTHFIEAFVCTLDYILVTGNFEEGVCSAPTPSLDEVKKYVALPNEYFPSDHISLGCDLLWK